MSTLTITRPDDWHIHFRDGAALSRTVNDAARWATARGCYAQLGTAGENGCRGP